MTTAAPRARPGAAPATVGGVRRALDTTVRLDLPLDVPPGADAVRLRHLLDLFPPALGSTAPSTRYALRAAGDTTLWRDGDLVARADDPGDLVVPLFADLTASAMASFAGFAAHAAVVTGPGGSIALLGASGAGKSTLAAACLAAGLGYCSDEALCLRYDTAAVVPFPRPVSLLDDSPVLAAAPGGRRRGGYFHPGELGGAVDHAPPPVAHVVILGDRATGAPVLTASGAADGVQALLHMGFNHFRAPAEAVDVTTRVVAAAAVWRLRTGDPARTAAVIAELADASAGRGATG